MYTRRPIDKEHAYILHSSPFPSGSMILKTESMFESSNKTGQCLNRVSGLAVEDEMDLVCRRAKRKFKQNFLGSSGLW